MADKRRLAQSPDRVRPGNNTTCDIYHVGNAPPASPDVAGVACHLAGDYRSGSEAAEGDSTFRWTHLLYVDGTVDIRDGWPTAPNSTVYVPDKDGTRFDIVFVELVNRAAPTRYKRVFLRRHVPTWPTDEL